MRVGIMTMYHGNFNFGGQLQALALQHAVESFGYDCKVIDFAAAINAFALRKIVHVSFDILSKKTKQKAMYWIKNKTDKDFHKNCALRKKRFRNFMERIPHTDFCTSVTIRDLFINEFDACIVGSDQVWNPEWWVPEYFLDFASERTKKIAYAASLGTGKLSETDGKYLADQTKNFAAISLREQGAEKFLQKYISRPLTTTLDPTLLWNKSFWDTVAVKPDITEPYVVFYFPGGKSESVLRICHMFCEQEGLKLVAFPHFQGKHDAADEKYSHIRDYSSGPAEFLGLIKHARYVMTGSFHATVFSIIFHKQFVSFRKEAEKSAPAEILRNGSLLKSLGIEDRLVQHDWIPQLSLLDKMVDYTATEKRLSELREESLSFLKNALGGRSSIDG